MRKMFIALIVFILPSMVMAEEKHSMKNTNPNPVTGEHHMQNGNPSPAVESKEEAPLTRHMQNRNPNPNEVTPEPEKPAHMMKNTSPN